MNLQAFLKTVGCESTARAVKPWSWSASVTKEPLMSGDHHLLHWEAVVKG
jgi:hypothetical protein